MSFDEIIGSPLDSFQRVTVLSGVNNISVVLNDTPGEHCYGKCHWKTKLHIVAGIVIASDQFHLRKIKHKKIKNK